MAGNRRTLAIGIAVAAVTVMLPQSATADLVFLTSGRTLSVKSYTTDGDTITLVLRAGGTMALPRAIVERIGPDEVAYPEPEVADAPAAGPAALPANTAIAARPYAELIATVATAHGLDAKLVHAVVAEESNYRPRARSPKGARGLMQLMPGTARQYAVRDPYDPQSNLDAGVRHLKDLMSRLELRLALAAYNAGEGMIHRYDGMPPFAETRNYVRRILARVAR